MRRAIGLLLLGLTISAATNDDVRLRLTTRQNSICQVWDRSRKVDIFSESATEPSRKMTR